MKGLYEKHTHSSIKSAMGIEIKGLRLGFITGAAPDGFIVNGKFTGGTPYCLYYQNMLNVSRALYGRGSNPLLPHLLITVTFTA
jgi:hypothetical protein